MFYLVLLDLFSWEIFAKNVLIAAKLALEALLPVLLVIKDYSASLSKINLLVWLNVL